jgi:hypothetical protein
MASFSSFWSTDFEVPPLHVPESSPTQLAQPRHPEQTQGGALMDASRGGFTEDGSSHDAGSRNPRVEMDARTGERIIITSPGPEVATDARTGERTVFTRQHAPIGSSGGQHYVWSHPAPTWPMYRGAIHTQNELVTEATMYQSSINTDEVTHTAAESVVRHDVITEAQPSRSAPNDHVSTANLQVPDKLMRNRSWDQPILQRTRKESDEHEADEEERESELIAEFNEHLEISTQEVKEHVVKSLPPDVIPAPRAPAASISASSPPIDHRSAAATSLFRSELHKRSSRDIYHPSRTPRSESPVRTKSSGLGLHTSATLETRPCSEDLAQNGIVRIRDGSRARSVVPVGFSGEICEICLTCGHQRHYCNVCTYVFCDPCWETQFLHRTKRSNPGLPHEKTDPYVAKKIGGVLNPQLKEEQREQLHYDDIDTTWFGVVREGHERPMFQDYGRYADLVAGVKELRLGSVSTLSASSDHSEALYPSLVSFVGETGAGKSSLIKLIIDLKSDEDEPFETPVVGAAGRDVATSEDVHLYLDPESSESQAPLLFADCEGLNGGERDPVGARLKRKMASSQKNKSGGRRKPTSERELVWADTAKKQSRDFAVAHLYPRLLYTFSDVIVFVVKNPR